MKTKGLQVKCVTRVWEGRKECATSPYYCGQVWDAKRQLWDTVTAEFDNAESAEFELDLKNLPEEVKYEQV